MKRFLDRWCGALWHFRWYRRWYIKRYSVRRVFEAEPLARMQREAAQLATNRRFLHDMGIVCAEPEEWDQVRDLVDSAAHYCPECPIQGTCGTCGRYHGAAQ